MYGGYSATKDINTWAKMSTRMYRFGKVMVWDHTTVEEFLGFAGVVYSFMYFLVGYYSFYSKGTISLFIMGALVSFDIILMKS
jgi:hypothetical protein